MTGKHQELLLLLLLLFLFEALRAVLQQRMQPGKPCGSCMVETVGFFEIVLRFIFLAFVRIVAESLRICSVHMYF